MARETAEERRQMKEGQGSGTSPKRQRRPVVAPPLVFFGDLNERHAYLNFDNMPQPHKNNALNRLYKLQTHKICPRKFFGPFYIQYYGLEDDFRQWFSLGMKVGNQVANCGLWDNVFSNREPVYRELCLEFYSTVRVTKELHKVKDIFEERVVIFMCGGVQRKASIAEFGAYVGMYTIQDLSNPDWRNLLRKGYYVKADLGDNESIAQYWTRISGGEEWTIGGYVSVNKIKSVRLRLLHRILVNSFIQRSSHWDKAHLLDLWLMKLFTEGSLRKFALAPMVLLDRMCNHSDSDLVLGHFITRIYRYMGIFDLDACQTYLSHPVYHIEIDRKELIRAKIVKKKEGSIPDRWMDDEGEIGSPPSDVEDDDDVYMEEAQQEPQPQPRRRSPAGFDLSPLQSVVERMYEEQQAFHSRMDSFREQVGGDMTMMGSGLGRVVYDSRRYQPMWEAQLRGQDFSPPIDLPDYRPPAMFIPHQRVGRGFYFPPEHVVEQPPRHDPGALVPDMPVRFGTYTGSYAGMDVSQAGPSEPTFAEQVVGSFFDYGNLPGHQHFPPHPPPQ